MVEHQGIIYGYAHPDGKLFYVGQARNLAVRHAQHLHEQRLPVERYVRTLETPPEPIELKRVTSPTRAALIDDLAFWETVLMFQHRTIRTWFPKDGGFNFCVPQSKDYLAVARLGGFISGPITGRRNGAAAVKNHTGVHAPGFDHTIGGRRAAITNRKNGTGLYSPAVREKGRGMGAAAAKAKGVGIWAEGVASNACRKRNALYGNPQTAEGSRKAGLIVGPILGRKNVESGWIQALGNEWGNKAVQLQTGIHAPNYDHSAAARIGMEKRVGVFSLTSEQLSNNARKGRHKQWHTNRGIVSPTCKFCSVAIS